MKILVVIPTVHGGGAEQVAAILSRSWSDEHDVRVIAWQAPGRSLDFGVPVRFLDLGVKAGVLSRAHNVWQRVRALRCEMRAYSPDVVMAFMDEAGIPAILAATLEGALGRVIVSVHHNPRWLAPWRRFLLGCFYRLPAAVVAVSKGVGAELAAHLRLPAQRVHHIPNPLVTQHAEDNQAVEPGRPYLLFVGRLDRFTKGLDVLSAAYAALPEPKPALVIVGDGPDRAALEGEVAQSGLSHLVTFAGWVSDPRPFYRGALGFVLSSRYEGWSNVLMEAMGEGCPVVATRCPHGPAEVLGEALADWLVPVADSAALAAGMQRILALKDAERASLAVRLRARAAEFSVDKVAPQWIALARTLPALRGAAS